MFKKTIQYKNLDGEDREKTFYFHLGKADLLKMAATEEVEGRLRRIVSSQNPVDILKEVQALVEMSVGERSEDGDMFIRSPETTAKLMMSPAWDELLIELATKADATVEFVKNVLPASMQNELLKAMKEQENIPIPFEEDPAWIRENRDPTDNEVRNMTSEQLRQAFARKLGK